jgi:WhiB family redox-sensing transcriptional regulator
MARNAPILGLTPKPFSVTRSLIAAKAICQGCSLKTQCFEYALENDYEGVWGGTTDDDRQTIKSNKESLE